MTAGLRRLFVIVVTVQAIDERRADARQLDEWCHWGTRTGGGLTREVSGQHAVITYSGDFAHDDPIGIRAEDLARSLAAPQCRDAAVRHR